MFVPTSPWLIDPLIVRPGLDSLVCLILLAGLLAAGADTVWAPAQETTLSDDTTHRMRSTPPIRTADQISPALATSLSLGGTGTPMFVPFDLGPRGGDPVFSPGRRLVIGVVSVGLGLTFGPALGHFYAEHPKTARRGIYVRTGIVVASASFALMTFDSGRYSTANVLGFGAIAMTGHAIYDIIRAARSARQYNEGRGTPVCVSPTANLRSRQVGFSLHVQV